MPLIGSYQGSMDELGERDSYDNHPAMEKNAAKVKSKFAAEEDKSFHLLLPHFMVHFLLACFFPQQFNGRSEKVKDIFVSTVPMACVQSDLQTHLFGNPAQQLMQTNTL